MRLWRHRPYNIVCDRIGELQQIRNDAGRGWLRAFGFFPDISRKDPMPNGDRDVDTLTMLSRQANISRPLPEVKISAGVFKAERPEFWSLVLHRRLDTVVC